MNDTSILFVSKLKIAETQIDVAVRCFLDDEDYVSAITLAGAGEEILGGMLENVGVQPAVKDFASASVEVCKAVFGQTWTTKHFVDLMNDIRNGLKHLRDGTDVPISRDAAAQMLDRAISNYWKLRSDQTPQMQRFMDEVTGL